MNVRYRQLSRAFHLWGALVIFIPVVIVIASGLLLQVKKQVDWIQPVSQRGELKVPSLSFDTILAAAQTVPEANISTWEDIDRLDVRPNKGIIKIQSNNRYEIQIDGDSGKVLQSAYRRSDIIEAIHDGSWFFEGAKLWIFLPVAVVLFFIWLSGFVLLYTTLSSKYKRNKIRRARV